MNFVRSPRRLTLVLALAAAFPALAQTSSAPADTGKLETVVITATKRVQPLQETPIAISVISGGALEEANLNSLSTITAQIPTVNFRSNASNKDTSLFIRGVGTISTSPGVEPTVSMVLDGVVTARPGQATLDLVELDRIEILRGPQGTLFGKNASAGVINVVTRAPTKETTGYLDLSMFQNGERRLRAGVSGEISKDVMRGSLSIMDAEYGGNVTNVFDGSKVNGYDRRGVRGKLEITPTKTSKITLIADHSKALDTTPTGVPYDTNVLTYPTNAVTANPLYLAAVSPVVPSPSNRQINSEMRTRVSDTNQGLSAQVDIDLGNLQFTSITAQRGWKNTQFQDQDRLSQLSRNFNQIADRGDLDFTQRSQEFRIATTRKQFLEYVAGVFWMKSENDEQYRRDVTRCPNSTATAGANGIVPCSAGSILNDNGVANFGVDSSSKALFGEGTWNFTPKLRAITGLRYTVDNLSYYHGRVASGTGIPGVQNTRATVTGSTEEKAWSGRIGPQFEVAKDLMVYATWSKGYKGPAYNVFFNMTPTQDNRLAPEKSTSIEAGFKSEFLDRRVRLNVAAFKTDYDGYQANVPDLVNGVVVTRLINAGKISTEGLEMDLTARVTQDFSITASVANTRARVKNFACPPGAAASCDINGKPMPYAPDWKGSLRLKYSQPLGGKLNLDWGLDASWQTKTNFDLQQQPNSFQPEYTIVNASVALVSDAGWRLALVGKNLTDNHYATFVQNSGNNINRYVPRDDTRHFGVTFRYDF